MEPFHRLSEIADTLLGPNGCSWDREQTLKTLQPYLLEETYELLEALDIEEGAKIEEELGDCLYALIFIAKLCEKEKKFYFANAVQKVCEKLIRRHPHVFGDVKVASNEEIVQNWESIKKKEGKTNPISGIPPALPALARAQKVQGKLRRMGKTEDQKYSLQDEKEEKIARLLWGAVREAANADVDAESALRRYCILHEQSHS